MKKFFNKIFPYLCITPTLAITITFVLIPIISSFIRSFKNEIGGFTFDNYLYFFTDPIMQKNITYTLFIAFMTVLLTIMIAYPFAIYVRFSKSKLSKTLYNLVLIPRFIPGMVAVYAIRQIITDSGLLNRIAMIFNINLQLGFMYTEKGIIYTNIWFNVPFATLIIASALASVSTSNIESAKDVGASTFKIFKDIVLPLSFKDALVAATFVFMSNVGSFTTPYLIGGNSPKMLGVVLNQQFSSFREYEKSAALSVIMFLICSVSAFVYIYTNLKQSKWEKA